jgi:hypothetical protein
MSTHQTKQKSHCEIFGTLAKQHFEKKKKRQKIARKTFGFWLYLVGISSLGFIIMTIEMVRWLELDCWDLRQVKRKRVNFIRFAC